MASFKQAIEQIAKDHEAELSDLRALDKAFAALREKPDLQMVAKLWGESTDAVAVKVLKAAGRKVPRNWLDPDRPKGRFQTRESLLERVWMMIDNRRLVSEISRELEISTREVNEIMETCEGQPDWLQIQPHHRGRARRGLLQP